MYIYLNLSVYPAVFSAHTFLQVCIPEHLYLYPICVCAEMCTYVLMHLHICPRLQAFAVLIHAFMQVLSLFCYLLVATRMDLPPLSIPICLTIYIPIHSYFGLPGKSLYAARRLHLSGFGLQAMASGFNPGLPASMALLKAPDFGLPGFRLLQDMPEFPAFLFRCNGGPLP